METPKNKRKLAAVSRGIQEKNTTNGQSRNTSVPRIDEENNTQISEEIEDRFTKKLSHEFSRIETHILGAVSNIDEFLLNPQIRTLSVTVPGTSRNTASENQEPTGDNSQNYPHSEVEFSVCQSRNSIVLDPEEVSHSNSCDFADIPNNIMQTLESSRKYL